MGRLIGNQDINNFQANLSNVLFIRELPKWRQSTKLTKFESLVKNCQYLLFSHDLYSYWKTNTKYIEYVIIYSERASACRFPCDHCKIPRKYNKTRMVWKYQFSAITCNFASACPYHLQAYYILTSVSIVDLR